MCSKSITKTLAVVLCAAIALFLTTASTASAQELLNGRGISSGNGGNSFSNPLAPQFDQPANNPLSGIFKKPAFLENFKMPKLEFKKPNLGNLFSPPASGEQTMLGKMKAKTDAFFSKALAFEKMLPGRKQEQQTGGSPEWESVRKSMEEILARQGEQHPLRSASGSGDTIRR